MPGFNVTISDLTALTAPRKLNLFKCQRRAFYDAKYNFCTFFQLANRVCLARREISHEISCT